MTEYVRLHKWTEGMDWFMVRRTVIKLDDMGSRPGVGWLVGWLNERNEDMDYCLSTLAVHVQCELNCFLEKQ